MYEFQELLDRFHLHSKKLNIYFMYSNNLPKTISFEFVNINFS